MFSIQLYFKCHGIFLLIFLCYINYIFSVENISIENMTELPDLPASVSEGTMLSYYYIILLLYPLCIFIELSICH